MSTLNKFERIYLAVLQGELRPGPDFCHWDLAGKNGWTVAHHAAQCRKLPAGFKHWGLADNKGRTVAEVALAHRAKTAA